MPSRLFWFLIGAGTATWWIKRPLAHDHHHQREGRFFVDCGPGYITYGRRTIRQEGDGEPQVTETSRRWNYGSGNEAERKEMVKDLSRMAGDRAAEITEITLDALNSLTDTLRAKLAEHRAAREAEDRRQQEFYAQRSRSASDPQRYV